VECVSLGEGKGNWNMVCGNCKWDEKAGKCGMVPENLGVSSSNLLPFERVEELE